MDAIFLWVNGEDKQWQLQKAQAQKADQRQHKSEDVGTHRYKSNKDIYFAVELLLQNAPFVRYVHIVTCGQIPPYWRFDSRGWTKRGKVRLVKHVKIFKHGNHLPTFNSSAIEMNLHRIPGLSERFLYLNDDMFILNRVNMSDFIHRPSNKIKYFAQPQKPMLYSASMSTWAYLKYYNAQEIKRAFDYQITDVPLHQAMVLCKTAIREAVKRCSSACTTTSSCRFRADVTTGKAHVNVYLFYYAALILGHSTRQQGTISNIYLDRSQISSTAVARIHKARPKLLCINDSPKATTTQNSMVEKLLRHYLVRNVKVRR